jgi:hypothetical protein
VPLELGIFVVVLLRATFCCILGGGERGIRELNAIRRVARGTLFVRLYGLLAWIAGENRRGALRMHCLLWE